MNKLPIFSAPQSKATAGFGWFVYGSSLDFDALRAWCGEHGYVVPDLGAAVPAVLDGWRLAFNVRSNFWGGTVASIVPEAGASVEGLLIPLPADALGFVRHKEGVLSGLFEERPASCRLADGSPREALVYTAAPSRTVAEEAPAPRFLATLVKGARERGLSPQWVSALEQRAG